MSEHPEKFALIIGAMKSGTTSLFNYLSNHPEICGSREKEPFAFAKNDYPNDINTYRDLWDWDASHHKIAMEASTDYTKYPVVKNIPERVSKLGKDRFKLIYIIRHPLKRIESHTRYTILTKCEVCGVREYEKDFSLLSGVRKNHIAFSSYAMQLNKWMEYFDKNNLFIVTLEELQQNTPIVLSRITDFLGLDGPFDFDEVGKVYGKTSEVKQEYDAHSFWKRLRSISYLEKIIVNLLSKRLRQRLRNYFGVEINRFILNENERKYALEKLMPDIRELSNNYQVDTEKWWGIN